MQTEWNTPAYNGAEWKRISPKQSARWQHLSRLKGNSFFSLQNFILVVKKCNNLYFGLVMPSSGRRSPINYSCNFLTQSFINFYQPIDQYYETFYGRN